MSSNTRLIRWTRADEQAAAKAALDRMLASGWQIVGKSVSDNGVFGCYTLQRGPEEKGAAQARPRVIPEEAYSD